MKEKAKDKEERKENEKVSGRLKGAERRHCHGTERRRAAALSRFAGLQRVRVSARSRGSVNVRRSRRVCSVVCSAGVVVVMM